MTTWQDKSDISLKNFEKVVVRFAPSPTGSLHVGNTRTALINDLFYRSTLLKNQNNPEFISNSRFILRIDDTDKLRSKPEHERSIISDLKWLDINTDAFYRQSERMDLYRNAMQKLIAAGRLYPCYESKLELDLLKKQLLSNNKPPIYDRRSLKLTAEQKQQFEAQGIHPHWRFLLLDTDISWYDRVRGAMHFKGSSLNDPILIKENGEMTYTLASVVDDIEMGITDIIRGEDHLSNSATHIQIFEALGASYIPNFAHLSLLYNKDQEISKRLGGFEIANLRTAGIEPETIRAFFSKIGSSDPVKAVYDSSELATSFDFTKFSRASVHYDFRELELFNTKLIQNMDYFNAKEKISAILQENSDSLANSLKMSAELTRQNIVNNLAKEEKMNLFWQTIRSNIDNFLQLPQWYAIFFASRGEWPVIREELIGKASQTALQSDTAATAAPPLEQKLNDKPPQQLDLQPSFCATLVQFLPHEPWNNTVFENWIAAIKSAEAHGGRKGKELFLPIRLALTGLPKGPDINHIMMLLGRDEVIARLNG